MTQQTPDSKEPYVGKELGSVSFTVTEAVLQRLLRRSEPLASTGRCCPLHDRQLDRITPISRSRHSAITLVISGCAKSGNCSRR